MAAPSCILNNILVELPKAFNDEIIADGGTKFFLDASLRPEWNVTISGKVASVPKVLTAGGIVNHSFYPDRADILPVVKAGDEIIFSYLVVMSRTQTDNVGEVYEKDKPIDPYITTWTNPSKLRIFRVYHNNNKYECGLFDLKSGTWLDKVACNEAGVEAFLSKYMATENVGFNYKNLLPHFGKEYWKVDYINAIAIKKETGFEMIGDYVLLEPIREPRRGFEQGLIEVYEVAQETDYKATARVVSIGEPLKNEIKLNVKPNDIIYTDIRYAEKYHIDGHDYWVVRQKYLLAKSGINEHQRDT